MSRLVAAFAAGAFLSIAVSYALMPVLQVAVGYPALLACAGVFVQGRSIEDIQAIDFAHRMELSLVSISVDHAAKTVTATLLGGYLAVQVAKCAPAFSRARQCLRMTTPAGTGNHQVAPWAKFRS